MVCGLSACFVSPSRVQAQGRVNTAVYFSKRVKESSTGLPKYIGIFKR